MDETYTSSKSTIHCIEDLDQVFRTSGASAKTWLVFTNKITWPGPEYHLVGGPQEIPARVGIRGIDIEKIAIDISQAFQLASDLLHRTNCGDAFVGAIDLYWPLVAPGLCPEPNYYFTTNCNSIITVGAFTGNTHFS
ncbi:hypothetical protein EA58_16745 [Photobacterium galatheae]|uniref:Uncharacterized protein n=2 Tax=Photobacterium galatheae TaxID=1654360 RepID=A0A066RSK3_9GAMM|nr:hypothetical protein EA58_16745 [Photobacterium galatheae]